MRQSPGLKAGRLSFQGGLPCPSFCSSNANSRPPSPSMWRIAGRPVLQPQLYHRSKPAAVWYAAAMVSGYSNAKSKNAVSAPERGLCEWQQKTPPSPNEWFWQMPALFPVFRYISSRYRYIMGNYSGIGV